MPRKPCFVGVQEELVDEYWKSRYEMYLPVSGRLVDKQGYAQEFEARTIAISRDSVAIELEHIEGVGKLLESFLSTDQVVEIVIGLPAEEGQVTAQGSVKWLDTGAIIPTRPYLRAGISLETMSSADKSRWTTLMRACQLKEESISRQ